MLVPPTSDTRRAVARRLARRLGAGGAVALTATLVACAPAPPPAATPDGAAPVTGAAGATAPPVTRTLAADVAVTRLAPGLWMHVTRDAATGYPSNGMLLETESGAVLFDTAWDDRQTRLLLDWAAGELRRPVRRAVVTHAHADRVGGLRALRDAGVAVQALGATTRLVAAEGAPAPDSIAALAAGPVTDAAGYELFFPGPGHAPDNVVVYFAGSRVLFGGCLVKADTATTVGNVADADVDRWPETVLRVRERYAAPAAGRAAAALVVPGHGAVGPPSALDSTAALIRAKGPAAREALRRRGGR